MGASSDIISVFRQKLQRGTSQTHDRHVVISSPLYPTLAGNRERAAVARAHTSPKRKPDDRHREDTTTLFKKNNILRSLKRG